MNITVIHVIFPIATTLMTCGRFLEGFKQPCVVTLS